MTAYRELIERRAEAKQFREWFEQRYGHPYPAYPGEDLSLVMRRVAEAVADYTDEVNATALRALEAQSKDKEEGE